MPKLEYEMPMDLAVQMAWRWDLISRQEAEAMYGMLEEMGAQLEDSEEQEAFMAVPSKMHKVLEIVDLVQLKAAPGLH